MFPLCTLRGVQTHRLKQALRPSDGVRGLFLRAPVERGDLILSIPLSYCFFPWGLRPSPATPAEPSVQEARHQRRCNRGKELFPELWTWMQRLSPDTPEEGGSVSLTSSTSEGGAGVFSVALSPVEAALIVCVALRYFFGAALGLPEGTARRLRGASGLFASPAAAADQKAELLTDRYVTSTPMALYLAHGVESLFVTEAHDAAEHVCLEQLSFNLRDACLTYASADQYRCMDANPTLLDSVILAAVYVVRARVLSVPMLSSPNTAAEDRNIDVLAPGLDLINHAPPVACTAAAAVSPHRGSVVVRAARRACKGDEVTVDYGAARRALPTRYLLSSHDGDTGPVSAPVW